MRPKKGFEVGERVSLTPVQKARKKAVSTRRTRELTRLRVKKFRELHGVRKRAQKLSKKAAKARAREMTRQRVQRFREKRKKQT